MMVAIDVDAAHGLIRRPIGVRPVSSRESKLGHYRPAQWVVRCGDLGRAIAAGRLAIGGQVIPIGQAAAPAVCAERENYEL